MKLELVHSFKAENNLIDSELVAKKHHDLNEYMKRVLLDVVSFVGKQRYSSFKINKNKYALTLWSSLDSIPLPVRV